MNEAHTSMSPWTKIVVQKNEAKSTEQAATALIEALTAAMHKTGTIDGVEAWHIDSHSARHVFWFSGPAIDLLRNSGGLAYYADHVTSEDRPDLTEFRKIGL